MDATTLKRFLSKVAIDENGCWLWTGAKITGYGVLKVQGRMVLAHRLAYEHWCGPIAEGMYILHGCDVPTCCNPAHLSVGTHADNMADRQAKGRHVPLYGTLNGRAKVNETLVQEIRLLADEDDRLSFQELGTQYGLSRWEVSRIVKGKTWQHVACA